MIAAFLKRSVNKYLGLNVRFFILAVFLFTSKCYSATYYVDYDSGSDNNSGISTSSAWKHCPGDGVATSVAAASILAPGDTVLFKGGVSYVLTGAKGISLKWSGTSGNSITYDGNSAGHWGTGKAILTDNYGANHIQAFYGGASQYLTFLNFEFYGIGGSKTLPADTGSTVAPRSGSALYFGGSVSSVLISNCYFHELGYYFNKKPMGASSIDGCGVRIDGCNGLTITNCEFQRLAVACEIFHSGSVQNLDIGYCSFHDSIVWCIDLAPGSSNAFMDNTSIHDCTFYDYNQFDGTNWAGYGEWPHTDGIFDRCDYDGVHWGTNNNIYNNLFYSSNAAGGTASIYVTEGPSVNIYNNVFIYQGKGRTIYLINGPHPGASPQVVNIFNNTCLTDYCTFIEWGLNGASPPQVASPGSWIIRNNLVYDVMTGSGNNFIAYSTVTDPMATTSWNYDLYKSFNRDGTFFYWTPKGEWNLTGLRSYGWEINGINADPLFVNLNVDSTKPLSNDLHLRTNSPAIGAGVNLGSYRFPGLSSDKDGRPRPVSGAWDIGAYQFAAGSNNAVSSVTPTIQSFGQVMVGMRTNLPFVVQNTGSGILTGSATVALPFTVVAGGQYVLNAGQSQSVIVQYAPTSVGTNNQTILFSGGGGTAASVTGIGVIAPPSVSPIIQSGADVDTNASNLQIFTGSVAQYSASASDPNGNPLSWQWIYSVNGGSETIFQSGTGVVSSVSFTYDVKSAGSTYLWKLRVSNGFYTNESDLSLSVTAAKSAGDVSLLANSGTVTLPFVVTNGYIFQPLTTTVPTNGGLAVFPFTINQSGSYAIIAMVNAPNDANNSFFINIDAEPQDPTMIWDIPTTIAFQQRSVSWRGNGTDTNNQFAPKYFSLTPGSHVLLLRGRESNTSIENFLVHRILSAPSNLRVVPSP